MSFQRLSELRKEVARDHIVERPVDHLSLFQYSFGCIKRKAWNNTTTKARGIVFDTNTGTVVCRPFTKFFNVGERSNTKIKILARKLQKQKAFATQKLDGTTRVSGEHQLQVIYFLHKPNMLQRLIYRNMTLMFFPLISLMCSK